MKLKEVLTKHNAKDMTYMTVSMDDYRYLYVSPIANHAELDKNPMADVSEKVGEEEMGKIWAGFDDCYDSHTNYLIYLNKDLSTQPGGINMEDQKFREFTYMYIHPKHEKAAWEIAKEWKQLYEEKGVKTGYRFYSGGIGMDIPMFMVVRQASNQAELDATRDAELKVLGESAGELWQRTLAVCRKIEVYGGMMRPDLSYMPE